MPRKLKISTDPAELRRRAETRLRHQRKGQHGNDLESKPQAGGQRSKVSPEKVRGPRRKTKIKGQPRTVPVSRPGASTSRTLHELEVHQIELEMQNAELQEARNKLEVALQKYTDLYDFAPVGYLTLDSEGIIREANLAGASLLRVERSALVKRRFGLFVSAGEVPTFGTFLRTVFGSKQQQSCELTLQVHGRPSLEVAIEAIVAESGQACRVTLTDITERKRAERDRLLLNRLESTGILADGIAHDFNNLLTIILLNLELAQMLNPPGDELAGHLEQAKQTSLLARGLTTQLVTFAHGGAPTRIATLLAGVIQESVRPALSGSNVRCEFSLPEDLWGAAVDASQIGQVIRNLVLNAREAMPEGGTVFVRAENVMLSGHEQPSLPAGEYVRVSVADQGAGIAKEVLPKIFDPYFSTKQRGLQKGMGLGLTICHAVVQRHEGAIAVESAAGAGTTFHLYLPAAREIFIEAKASAPEAVHRHGRVLVMDDEEEMRRVVGLALWGMGHAVELAEDGEKAVEAYKKARKLGRHFDAVLLDLTVRAGLGGQETVQALLRLDPGVQAVAMSGNVTHAVILDPERHGFKGALTKPFEVGKLRDMLARVMGSRPESKAVK